MIKTFTPVYDLFRLDGTAIDPSEISSIEVQRFVSVSGWAVFTTLSYEETFTDDLLAGQSYEYAFTVFLTDGTQSASYTTGPIVMPLSSPKPLVDVTIS
jgi:hypothetical protein